MLPNTASDSNSRLHVLACWCSAAKECRPLSRQGFEIWRLRPDELGEGAQRRLRCSDEFQKERRSFHSPRARIHTFSHASQQQKFSPRLQKWCPQQAYTVLPASRGYPAPSASLPQITQFTLKSRPHEELMAGVEASGMGRTVCISSHKLCLCMLKEFCAIESCRQIQNGFSCDASMP